MPKTGSSPTDNGMLHVGSNTPFDAVCLSASASAGRSVSLEKVHLVLFSQTFSYTHGIKIWAVQPLTGGGRTISELRQCVSSIAMRLFSSNDLKQRAAVDLEEFGICLSPSSISESTRSGGMFTNLAESLRQQRLKPQPLFQGLLRLLALGHVPGGRIDQLSSRG